ncbi:hypothetical protein [Plantactinospora sp. B5E13]|uniref:hypothetical protein n=1 Tax=Plantactinospora sp. B5E13 TaxID=3153758 RepID=UPI00325CDE62
MMLPPPLPPIPHDRSRNPVPGKPLRPSLLAAALVSIVVAAGVLGWLAGQLAAPVVCRWQSTILDETRQPPPLPPLPRPPFAD